MATTVQLPTGAKVTLFGNRARFWSSGSVDPVYEGLIDNLPQQVLDYLLTNNHIVWRDE
jgi:hypothetical protein